MTAGKKMLVPLTASLYVPIRSMTLRRSSLTSAPVTSSRCPVMSSLLSVKSKGGKIMLLSFTLQKTMGEGKEYCERKINLWKSNFDELLESLLHAAGLRPTPAQATTVSWVFQLGSSMQESSSVPAWGARMDSEPKSWRILATEDELHALDDDKVVLALQQVTAPLLQSDEPQKR